MTRTQSSAATGGDATAANQVLEIAALDAIQTSADSVDTKTPVLGQALEAGSVPVVLTALQLAAITPVSPLNTTATLSNVSSSATNVTLLASNVARHGAMIHNDSTAILYVKFGTTATTSSYTVKMVADAYYEVPFGYTGRIDGIWASANGAARVTEITA